MSTFSDLTNTVLPEPVIHTPLVRKKRSLSEAPVANLATSSSSSAQDLSCKDSKIPTGKKLKHKLPMAAVASAKECSIHNEVEAVMQDMKEAGTPLKIRRQLWYPVQQLMQKIALDTYWKVDKLYREKKEGELPQRSSERTFHELKEAAQIAMIPKDDLHKMERLIENFGYEAFVEIERFYCELEEYEVEDSETQEEKEESAEKEI
jgi:hypothetical protein